MKHNIIQTENYLLVVDDKKTIENWYYNESEGKVDSIEFTPNVIGGTIVHNIKAHLPLNNSPILREVPLLPPLEDDVDKLSADYTEEWCGKRRVDVYIHNAFKAGYNKAKEKYKYTEEDMRKAIEMARNGKRKATDTKGAEYLFSLQEDEIIQSFKQPKLPVAFNCEENIFFATNAFCTDVSLTSDGLKDTILRSPKTTTNSQGITQWVGSYIYE